MQNCCKKTEIISFHISQCCLFMPTGWAKVQGLFISRHFQSLGGWRRILISWLGGSDNRTGCSGAPYVTTLFPHSRQPRTLRIRSSWLSRMGMMLMLTATTVATKLEMQIFSQREICECLTHNLRGDGGWSYLDTLETPKTQVREALMPKKR